MTIMYMFHLLNFKVNLYFKHLNKLYIIFSQVKLLTVWGLIRQMSFQSCVFRVNYRFGYLSFFGYLFFGFSFIRPNLIRSFVLSSFVFGFWFFRPMELDHLSIRSFVLRMFVHSTTCTSAIYPTTVLEHFTYI